MPGQQQYRLFFLSLSLCFLSRVERAFRSRIWRVLFRDKCPREWTEKKIKWKGRENKRGERERENSRSAAIYFHSTKVKRGLLLRAGLGTRVPSLARNSTARRRVNDLQKVQLSLRNDTAAGDAFPNFFFLYLDIVGRSEFSRRPNSVNREATQCDVAITGFSIHLGELNLRLETTLLQGIHRIFQMRV